MKQKVALLLGAYGQTNLGDDLLLYDYVKYLNEHGFTKIYINASEAKNVPQVIRQGFPHVEIFETYRTSPFMMMKLARRSDVIFYGGGTVYKELYATTGRAPYTVIAGVAAFNVMARLMRKKIYGLNIGIGTIKTGLGRWLTRRALKASTRTIFRDETSYIYAKTRLRIPRKKIDHATDGLFLNPAWREVWHKYRFKKASKRRVAVNVLSDIPDWIDRRQYVTMIRAVIKQLLEKGEYVVLLPFQTDFNPTNDLAFMKKEILPYIKDYKNYEVASDVGIDTIVSLLKQCDVLIGMRLHSLLLATASETPFVGVAYDTKCWRFITEAAYPFAVKLEDATDQSIIQLYEKLMQQKADARKQLKKVADENYTRADAWLNGFAP